ARLLGRENSVGKPRNTQNTRKLTRMSVLTEVIIDAPLGELRSERVGFHQLSTFVYLAERRCRSVVCFVVRSSASFRLPPAHRGGISERRGDFALAAGFEGDLTQ